MCLLHQQHSQVDVAGVQVLDDNIYEQRARRRLEADAGEDGNISHPDEHQASTSARPLSKGEREGEDGKEGNVDFMETDDVPTSESRVPSSTREKIPGVASCFMYSSLTLSAQSRRHGSPFQSITILTMMSGRQDPRSLHYVAHPQAQCCRQL